MIKNIKKSLYYICIIQYVILLVHVHNIVRIQKVQVKVKPLNWNENH